MKTLTNLTQELKDIRGAPILVQEGGEPACVADILIQILQTTPHAVAKDSLIAQRVSSAILDASRAKCDVVELEDYDYGIVRKTVEARIKDFTPPIITPLLFAFGDWD